MNVHSMTMNDPTDLEAALASLTAAEALEALEEADAPEGVEVIAAPAKAAPEPAQALSDDEALLADLEAITAPSAPVEVEVAPIDDDLLDEDLLADLETTVARAEAYESQAAATTEIATMPADPAAATTKAPKKARAASTGTPRTPRKDLNMLSTATFQRFDGETDLGVAMAETLKVRPAQVKVAEKFDNLFQAIELGKEPSRYVVTGYKLLKASGTMTSADLIGAMKAEGLGDGTARSQTGQVLALFAAVGIANRAGQALTLRADSTIAKKLDAILSL